VKTTEQGVIKEKSLEIPWLSLLTLSGLYKSVYWLERWYMVIGKLKHELETIGSLLDKHIVEERVEREELAEKVAWYEKNINPLSWGKRKKK